MRNRQLAIAMLEVVRAGDTAQAPGSVHQFGVDIPEWGGWGLCHAPRAAVYPQGPEVGLATLKMDCSQCL